MNQGKLEVVKSEKARMNIDILAITELKWTGMCEFNSDDCYIYYRGQESLRRNGVPIIVKMASKESEMQYLPAAAAAAKLLQSCPTLCAPIDGSPPVSPVPGILQARTLEWVAISFSNA